MKIKLKKEYICLACKHKFNYKDIKFNPGVCPRCSSFKYDFTLNSKKRHASGPWYKFIIPRNILLSNMNGKIIRWFNFYFSWKKDKTKPMDYIEYGNKK